MVDDMNAAELVRDLKQGSEFERIQAAYLLGHGRGGSRSRKALIQALRDESSTVRDEAGGALGSMGSQEALEDLVRSLQTLSPAEGRSTAWAVATLAATASSVDREVAIAALRSYHKRARGRTRTHALLLIERLGERV